MAVPMQHKRSAVAGKVPAVADIQLGELAINTTDGKLYLKRSVGGVESIVRIGGGAAEQGFFQRYDHTATAGQTVFTAEYMPGALVVALNGRTLQPANYTATNGTSVTILGAVIGDAVTIIAFSTFEVANTYTKAETAALIASAAAVDQRQLCTAWVNFNGTGTVSIRDSFNVSSITDIGTGRYTINFAEPMDNSNYSAVAGGNTSATTASTHQQSTKTTNFTTTGLEVTVSASSYIDWEIVTVAVFGGKN